MSSNKTKQAKKIAIIAYITIIGTVIAIFLNNENKNKMVSFHIRQALGLWITFYLSIAIANMFGSFLIHFPFYVFAIVLLVYGLVLAFKFERRSVPILGPYFQKWFSFIK